MKHEVRLLLRAPGQADAWEGEECTAYPAMGSALCEGWNWIKKRLPLTMSNTLVVTVGNGHLRDILFFIWEQVYLCIPVQAYLCIFRISHTNLERSFAVCQHEHIFMIIAREGSKAFLQSRMPMEKQLFKIPVKL